MADSNKVIVNRAFKAFGKIMDEKSLKWVENYAQSILYKAIDFRRNSPIGHDYTGNLLNSIVCAVYLDKKFKRAFFSGESGIRQPRYYEMTASHNGNGRYFFEIDYSGKRSWYKAEVETLRRKGLDDAYEFLSTYNPDKDGFLVVLAYTTEYANFIEQIRPTTTGYLNTRKYAEKLGMVYFQLPTKAA